MCRSVSLRKVAGILCAALLLTSCQEPPPPQATAPPEVTVARPLAERIVDWDIHLGRFEAVDRVELRPRVTGYLRDVHFEDGALVDEGQLMFTIDARPFEAALAEVRGRETAAAARLENARTELERARGLVEARAVSREEFEALEAALRSAEADLEAARAGVRARELDVEFTRVVAPVAGRASYRRVDPGNSVQADETVLTTIVTVDPIYFTFDASEALYLKYKRNREQGAADDGAAVRIRLQDEAEHRWTGTLDFLDNAVDPGSGTIRGRAVVANPDGFLTPGMFGHLELQASAEYTGLMLPDTAVATRGAQRIVYVVDAEGVVAAREVELGPLRGELRVIRSGLGSDDRAIIDGQQRARPGQRVMATAGTIEAPGRAAPSLAGAPASGANGAAPAP